MCFYKKLIFIIFIIVHQNNNGNIQHQQQQQQQQQQTKPVVTSNFASLPTITISNFGTSQQIPTTPILTKLEPKYTSTPIITTTTASSLLNKNTSNTPKLIKQATNLITGPINAQPVALLATSNGSGGITLTTLNNLQQQQQQQQQQFQQNNSAAAVAAALGLNSNIIGLNPVIIQQQQPTHLAQGQTIYQTNNQGQIQAVIKTSPNSNLNGQTTNLQNAIIITTNGANTIQQHQQQQQQQNQQHQQQQQQQQQCGFNAVTVAAAAELVNSLLVKSEQKNHHQILNEGHQGLINFAQLDNLVGNNSDQNMSTGDSNNNASNTFNDMQQGQMQHDQQIEDEKDAKCKLFASINDFSSNNNNFQNFQIESHLFYI